MYMLNMVIILIIMYSDVVTAIDKIHMYLLCFNNHNFTGCQGTPHIILCKAMNFFCVACNEKLQTHFLNNTGNKSGNNYIGDWE